MADEELTHDDVIALAGSFRVQAAKTLLAMARFPSWAIPETGYANALEFWQKIADLIAEGVMPDGRTAILRSAWRIFPYSDKLPRLPAAAESTAAPQPSDSPGAPGASGPTVVVTGGQGVVLGERNTQNNYYLHAPAPRATDGTASGADQPGPPADGPKSPDRPSAPNGD